jgi:hypothetical protein
VSNTVVQRLVFTLQTKECCKRKDVQRLLKHNSDYKLLLLQRLASGAATINKKKSIDVSLKQNDG